MNNKSIKYPMHFDEIYLRHLERDDIKQNTIWINSEYISEIMGYLPTMTLEQQYNWYDKLVNDNKRYIFAICLKENDLHIGNIGLGNIDYINKHAMLSIFIADTKYHSLKFGKKATLLILNFAFNRLNLNKVHLQTSKKFVSAIKLYESIGFSYDGTLRKHYYSNGNYEDKLIYSILKDEYETSTQNLRDQSNKISTNTIL